MKNVLLGLLSIVSLGCEKKGTDPNPGPLASGHRSVCIGTKSIAKGRIPCPPCIAVKSFKSCNTNDTNKEVKP